MNDLLEKIKKIEALINGAKTDGEKSAALLAKQRVQKRINKEEDIREYTIRNSDMWHKKLLIAVCRKYNLEPYRYYRQKYTTVMVKADVDLFDNIVWEEYLKHSEVLEELIDDITSNLINNIFEEKDETIIRGSLN